MLVCCTVEQISGEWLLSWLDLIRPVQRQMTQAQAAEVRRILDLRLSDIAAVKAGASKDEGLRRLNEREAKAEAARLRFAPRLLVN